MAPECSREAVGSTPFCANCLQAPAVKRGGWLSAAKRKRAFAMPVIDVPSHEVYDASNIAPKLWVGAKPPVDRSYPGVDMIVLCAAEYQPARFEFFDKTILRCPLPDDALSKHELSRALIASHSVAMALKKGQRVLSTCQQGRNRSALIAGLALGRITRATSQQIVDLIREKRMQTCLTNPHFIEYLERFVRGRQAREERK